MNETGKSISIRAIRKGDHKELQGFFEAVRSHGVDSYFHPHPFDGVTAEKIALHSGQDWYAAAWSTCGTETVIIGYVILRGWDAGFSIPSFGICVHPEWQGFGIGKLLMQTAITVSRLRGSPAIRLKVYPDNEKAIALYSQTGFQFGDCLENEQLVGTLVLGGQESGASRSRPSSGWNLKKTPTEGNSHE